MSDLRLLIANISAANPNHKISNSGLQPSTPTSKASPQSGSTSLDSEPYDQHQNARELETKAASVQGKNPATPTGGVYEARPTRPRRRTCCNPPSTTP